MVAIVAKDGDLHFLWGASVYKDTMFTVLQLDDIYYKVRLRDGEWTPTLNISNTGSAVVPVAIIDANGNPHVAWGDESPGNYDIYYTVINLSSGNKWEALTTDVEGDTLNREVIWGGVKVYQRMERVTVR